jgi:hypothetical protein
MSILTFFGIWFLVAMIGGPIVGTMIGKMSKPLDLNTTND